MAFSFNTTMSGTVFNGYDRTTTTQSFTSVETWTDSRSSLVKTIPSGKWRKPTSYSRSIESGHVKTFEIEGRYQYYLSGAKYNPYRYAWSGRYNMGGNYYDVLPAYPSNMENKAIIKARLKLKNQKINLAQAFAERDQTARLLVSNLKEITTLVKNVKRLNLKGIKKQFRKEAFFDRWLELQYGWKPLLMDCHGAMEALHEREKEADRGKVAVKAYVREQAEAVRLVSGGHFSTCNYTMDKLKKISHFGFIRLDFVQSNAPLTGTLAQAGITNPAELAWELLPWSFVADWFVPIGDYLSSLDATVGWDFMGGSFSRKTTQISRPIGGHIVPNTGELAPSGFVNGHGEGRQVAFSRIVYTTPPLPARPNTRFVTGSPLHVQNGIALLMSAIVGKSRVR